MNILLIGGPGHMMDQLIIKMKKEGHRVYIITGSSYRSNDYERPFERFNFDYENDNISEIFESVNPDVTVFFGAYDTRFEWEEQERDSVRYMAGLMNVLIAYASLKHGKFLYLSSGEVYSESELEIVDEYEPVDTIGFKGIALAQGEEICENYRNNIGLDVITVRIENVYSMPRNTKEIDNRVAKMCLEAMNSGSIRYYTKYEYSMIYENEVIEFLYDIISDKGKNYPIYNLSSSERITDKELANIVAGSIENDVKFYIKGEKDHKTILDNRRFIEEYSESIHHPLKPTVEYVCKQMERHKSVYLEEDEKEKNLFQRIMKKFGWMIKAAIPFVENVAIFIPFFMMNNRIVGSQHFAKVDFFLFYVLLFAIVYGQQQAIFSAVLAVSGYLFRQMYTRSGFEIMVDYSTYIWIAQLFIIGLVVGYMRDQIRQIKKESEESKKHLYRQIGDIKDINSSNVRVKDVLESQVINQQDSIGKIYSITSKLDQYMPEEVLFYAVDIVSNILQSPDVAIYSVYGSYYARLFSASSAEARKLGNSVRCDSLGEMYEELKEEKVYINKQLDERYPLMANAIFDNGQMQMIIMVWGIPWERMTLGQSNLLAVISYLIQNALLRANRYIEALENQRYVENTRVLEPEAFASLVDAYFRASDRNLTECSLLEMEISKEDYDEADDVLMANLRQTDYLGEYKDGKLYVLLANTTTDEANIVVERFDGVGYKSSVVDINVLRGSYE